jgi:AraC family transcriptional activator of pobA
MLVHFADYDPTRKILMTSTRRTGKPVPVFDLYGEKGQRAALDPIHVESIAARSSLHNWEIRPHRHHALFQLLWLEQGGGELMLDERPGRISAGSGVLVPQHCVHGFRFEPGAGGLVLTLAYPMLAAMPGALGRHLLAMTTPVIRHPARDGVRDELQSLLHLLAHEYGRQLAFRSPLLESLAIAILALLLRQPQAGGEPEGRVGVPAPASAHLAGFSAEIERSFNSHAPLAHYASRLGLSVAHLNALCRQYAGRSALGMIHDRLLLEARRNLVYTAMTVREVSDLLGFSDPAYFTRFFRRATGLSPTEFRERAARPESAG